MIILVVSGTKVHVKTLGHAVDTCPVCDGARVFSVEEHYHVRHVYGISLGRKRLVAVSRTCTACRQQLPCNPSRFESIVPIETARSMRFLDLFERTNPSLAASFELSEIESCDQGAGEFASATQLLQPGVTAHRHVRQLTITDRREQQRLAELLEQEPEARTAAAPLFDELRNWRRLDRSQREHLTQRIVAFAEREAPLATARKFLRHLTLRWPQWIGPLRLLLILAVSALPSFFLPQRANLAGHIIAYVIVAGVVYFIAGNLWLNRLRAGWIGENWLQHARDWELSPAAVLEVLAAPVDQTWDRQTIWSVIKMRRFKKEIEAQLEPRHPSTFDLTEPGG